MKILKKKLLVALVIACFAAISVTFGIFALGGKIAKAETFVSSTFEMEDGVSAKLFNDGGIRFRVKMDEETKSNIVNDSDITLEFVVAPLIYFENGAAENNNVTIPVDEAKIYADGDYYYANGCITDIKTANRALDYKAIARIKQNGTVVDATEENDLALGNVYDVLTSAVLDADNEFEDKIFALSAYSGWFGTEEYPIVILNDGEYTALKNKIGTKKDSFNGKYFVVTKAVTNYVASDFDGTGINVAKYYRVTLNTDEDTFCDTLEDYKFGTETTLPVPTKTGYTFVGWYESADFLGEKVTFISANATGAKIYYASFSPNTDTPYTVKHMKQNLADDNYTEADVVEMEGTTGEETKAVAKKYDHYNEQGFNQDKINAEGTTVIVIYYNLETVTITWKDYNGNLIQTDTIKYGSTVTAPAHSVVGYTDGYRYEWEQEVSPIATEDVEYTEKRTELTTGTEIIVDKSVDIDFSLDTAAYTLDLGTDFDADDVYTTKFVLVKNGLKDDQTAETWKTEYEVETAKAEGTAISISKTEAKAVPAGIYNVELKGVKGYTINTYNFEINLITKIVYTATDFANLSLDNNNGVGIYSQEERSQGYFVLANDIEFVKLTGTTGFRTINGGVQFSGIFDGRGHNINGFVTTGSDNRSGLFMDILGGIVRNVSFTNAVKGLGAGGLIAKKVAGSSKDAIVGNSTSSAANKAVGWYAELTNIFVSGRFNNDYTGSGKNLTMFIEYPDSTGSKYPNKSIKVDNIVIQMTKLPAKTAATERNWGALVSLTASANYGASFFEEFKNIYVFGTTILGRETSGNTLHSKWPNTSVYASAESDLTATLGDSTYGDTIAVNGSIWKYENGKLTMKSDSANPVTLLEDAQA